MWTTSLQYQTTLHWSMYIVDLQTKDTSLVCITDGHSVPNYIILLVYVCPRYILRILRCLNDVTANLAMPTRMLLKPTKALSLVDLLGQFHCIASSSSWIDVTWSIDGVTDIVHGDLISIDYALWQTASFFWQWPWQVERRPGYKYGNSVSD